MAVRVTSGLSWPSLVQSLVSHLRLTMRLLREPSVPLLTKASPILAALYLISPLDWFLTFSLCWVRSMTSP
jgi:hypothetical protein